MLLKRTLPFALGTYLVSDLGTVLTKHSNFNFKRHERGAMGEIGAYFLLIWNKKEGRSR